MAYGGSRAIRPIVPCIVRCGELERPTYAMLDCAATSSTILLEILESVQGEIFEKTCRLSTFDSCKNSVRDFTNFELLPLDKSYVLNIRQTP